MKHVFPDIALPLWICYICRSSSLTVPLLWKCCLSNFTIYHYTMSTQTTFSSQKKWKALIFWWIQTRHFLPSPGGDSHRGIGEEHVSRAEEDGSLPSSLRMAQEAVHRRCPRHGWHLLHAHAGKGGCEISWWRVVVCVQTLSLLRNLSVFFLLVNFFSILPWCNMNPIWIDAFAG